LASLSCSRARLSVWAGVDMTFRWDGGPHDPDDDSDPDVDAAAAAAPPAPEGYVLKGTIDLRDAVDVRSSRAPKAPPFALDVETPSHAVPKPNLQPDFNMSVFECFDTSSSAGLRELDESDRSVQQSAESTSI
jgi:hypothetical protein